MENWWSKRDRENVKRACNRWIKGNLTAQDIKETIDILDWAVEDVLPPIKGGYISSDVSILKDDILEMDSITDEEKDQAILELLDNGYEEELQSLAKRVIAQIEIDTQKYQEEAEERGFCRKLTEELIERNTDKEDE